MAGVATLATTGLLVSVGAPGVAASATRPSPSSRVVQPNTSNDLYYHGGLDDVGVMTGHEKVYLVFWGNGWGTASTDINGDYTFSNDAYDGAPLLAEMFKALGTAGDRWSLLLTQYCQGVAVGAQTCPVNSARAGYPAGGAFAGAWYDSRTVATTTSNQDIADEAAAAAVHFGNTSTAANRNVAYMILSPHGYHPDGWSPTAKRCAEHFWAGPLEITYEPYDLAYINMPYVLDNAMYCGMFNTNVYLDAYTVTASHEYAETVTDPFPNGGWLDSSGMEIADKCETEVPGYVTLSSTPYALHKIWVNSDTGPDKCKLAAPKNRYLGPTLGYDLGSGSGKFYTWYSSSTGFPSYTTNTVSLNMANAGNRMASGDLNGDSRSDIVTAVQNTDGTMSLRVLLGGSGSVATWYTSGPWNMSAVAGRLVVGDVNGDGRDDIVIADDAGGGTLVLYRWYSNGTGLSSYSTATYSNLPMSSVGDRMAMADVNGDGKADTVMAFQNSNGSFTFKVFLGGTGVPANWYTSGTFSLGPVAGRLVVGDVNGDGKADAILAYDAGGGTLTLWRWYSTGTSFPSYSTATYYNLSMANVGDRVAIGDVDGDGLADTAMAYQNSDGTFTFKVFPGGTGAPVDWYTSGSFNLGPVANRIVLGY